MTTPTSAPLGDREEILVGVDGSTASLTAVRYAALEADRCGVALRVLHVVPPLALGTVPQEVDPVVLAEIDTRLRRRRDRVLGSALGLARAVLADDRITTQLVDGGRVATLLSAAEHARMVIVGAPWHPWIDRLITGSVVGEVAARATVPVVAVPEAWNAEEDHGRIVVAVKFLEDPSAEDLVRRAIGIAAERKGRLTVLHAWEFPVAYDNMIATTFEEQAWHRLKRGSLAELASLTRGPHGEVPIDFQVVHGQGARAIVDASTTADLMVITRRRHGFPFGHLGAAGRTVLRESRCAVEVLPLSSSPGDDLPEQKATDP
jgi:nucleotide-binding universal stress UspA family protein